MPEVKDLDIKGLLWKDERGWGINPLQLSDKLKHKPIGLHIVSLKPGFIRGNHYHTNSTEWMFICEGTVRIVWRAIDEDIVKETFVDSGGPTLIENPSFVVHAVVNESKDEIYIAAFSDIPDPDIICCPSLINQ